MSEKITDEQLRNVLHSMPELQRNLVAETLISDGVDHAIEKGIESRAMTFACIAVGVRRLCIDAGPNVAARIILDLAKQITADDQPRLDA